MISTPIRENVRENTPSSNEKTPGTIASQGLRLEVTPGFEPGNEGFADPCLTTWLCHHIDNRSKHICSCQHL